MSTERATSLLSKRQHPEPRRPLAQLLGLGLGTADRDLPEDLLVAVNSDRSVRCFGGIDTDHDRHLLVPFLLAGEAMAGIPVSAR